MYGLRNNVVIVFIKNNKINNVEKDERYLLGIYRIKYYFKRFLLYELYV